MACGHRARTEFRLEVEFEVARVGFNETRVQPASDGLAKARADNSMVVRENKGSAPLMGYDFSRVKTKRTRTPRRQSSFRRTPPPRF